MTIRMLAGNMMPSTHVRKDKMADLHKCSHEFTQEGNTLGTTEEYEAITIEQETQIPGEEPFFVIRTQGWSINDADELKRLLDKCLWKMEKRRTACQRLSRSGT